MEDEWTTVISGDRLVKFTYSDLPDGKAFLTAQIAGHEVVYSVILRQAEHPFNREGVELVMNAIQKKEQMLKKVKELHEVNPMLGHRGVRLGLTFPEIYKMQILNS